MHCQFEKILSESLGSLETSVADMLMFDSRTTRNKSELRFCFWTVSNWASTVSLLCFCSELTSYHSLHYKYFCIKYFCCFEFRKVQKHIYYQRNRQFNRFQNRVYYVQWSECCYFYYSIKYFWKFKFTDRMITALNYNVFLIILY